MIHHPLVERVRLSRDLERERDEHDHLVRQLRRITERSHTTFDRGFAAAVEMVRRGADLEQLQEAQGTVAQELHDTEPVVLLDISDFGGDTEVEVHSYPERS